MSKQLSDEYKIQAEDQFAEIIKRAYVKGITDGTTTVESLIEEIKSEIIKMKEQIIYR